MPTFVSLHYLTQPLAKTTAQLATATLESLSKAAKATSLCQSASTSKADKRELGVNPKAQSVSYLTTRPRSSRLPPLALALQICLSLSPPTRPHQLPSRLWRLPLPSLQRAAPPILLPLLACAQPTRKPQAARRPFTFPPRSLPSSASSCSLFNLDDGLL
jgi:hypothetical protein